MKVKICGLQTKAAVDCACNSGADYIGFVFADSKRQVTIEDVKKITVDVPKSIKKVGVFVSPSLKEVKYVNENAELDMVQIHGKQLLEPINYPVIASVSVDSNLINNLYLAKSADYILLDAPPAQYYGGNGVAFDWYNFDFNLIKGQKVIIAGGLTKDNLADVQAIFNPYAVDVSSGVETNGKKDLEKITEFIKRAKENFYV